MLNTGWSWPELMETPDYLVDEISLIHSIRAKYEQAKADEG